MSAPSRNRALSMAADHSRARSQGRRAPSAGQTAARPPLPHGRRPTSKRHAKPRWGRIAGLVLVLVALLAGLTFGAITLARAAFGGQPQHLALASVATSSSDASPALAATATPVATGTVTSPKAGPPAQIVNLVKAFKCVPAPKGLAISPDNSEVWVTALVTRPSIGIYDPRTGKSLGRISLGKYGAVEVIFNSDGTKAYASQMQSHTVYEIDARTRKVLRKFNTGSPWTKVVLVSPDGTKLYAANWSGDDVSEISLKSGKLLRRIHTADTPRGLYITPDGKKMYVATFGEQTLKGYIHVFNLATGKGRTIGKGRAMRHMAADETTQRLYTSDLGGDCIWVTDMRTDTTKLLVKTDHKPNTIALSPDKRVLFVSCRGANNPKSYYVPGPEWGTVILYDAQTGRPLDAIVGGNQCTALDVSRDGSLLVFSDFLDARLRTYEVPGTDALLAGNGGYYQGHLLKVRKDGKPSRRGASGASGD